MGFKQIRQKRNFSWKKIWKNFKKTKWKKFDKLIILEKIVKIIKIGKNFNNEIIVEIFIKKFLNLKTESTNYMLVFHIF